MLVFGFPKSKRNFQRIIIEERALCVSESVCMCVCVCVCVCECLSEWERE